MAGFRQLQSGGPRQVSGDTRAGGRRWSCLQAGSRLGDHRPEGGERTPQPTKGLLRKIEAFLRRHALGGIADDIHALPPDYQPVQIAAKVRPKKPEEASLIEQRVVQALEAFFHPLSGGEQGEGWPFGRDVYISEVYAVIERTEGVDRVVEARFISQPEVHENVLVASGTHQITIT
jgi:hypothetical protein